MGNFIDLTGKRFGRLVVISRCHDTFSDKHIRWHCRCDCGRVVIKRGYAMAYGNVKSCGCYLKEFTGNLRRSHGQTGTRTYRIWKGIIRRCDAKSGHSWKYYGARGIGVCDRWRVFESFREDMGDAPAGLTIDRIDNDRGYEPSNCRWATQVEQARNQRHTTMLEFDGVTKPLRQWAEEYGINPHALRVRVQSGWSMVDALTRPSLKARVEKEAKSD